MGYLRGVLKKNEYEENITRVLSMHKTIEGIVKEKPC